MIDIPVVDAASDTMDTMDNDPLADLQKSIFAYLKENSKRTLKQIADSKR